VSDLSTGSNQLRRGGLGRGLASLIPAAPAEHVAPSSSDVPIDSIGPNPYQPRTEWDEERLSELAESIRTHGLIQPLIVSLGRIPGTYVLIAGERRLRAARVAGLDSLPVVITDVAPHALLEMALVENLVRADLSPLEEAQAYRQLIEDFGLTQQAVAERVGRSRVSVTNTLRLLNAPEEVQTALLRGEISEGHARALLGLGTALDQVALLRDIQAKGLNVRQTEEMARSWTSSSSTANVRSRKSVQQPWHLVDRLQRSLQTKVSIKRDERRGTGSMTIQFFDDEQLSEIVRRLAGDDEF